MDPPSPGTAGQRNDDLPPHMNDSHISWQKNEQSPWLLSDDCFMAGNTVVRVTAASTKQAALSGKAGHAEHEKGGSSMLLWMEVCAEVLPGMERVQDREQWPGLDRSPR